MTGTGENFANEEDGKMEKLAADLCDSFPNIDRSRGQVYALGLYKDHDITSVDRLLRAARKNGEKWLLDSGFHFLDAKDVMAMSSIERSPEISSRKSSTKPATCTNASEDLWLKEYFPCMSTRQTALYAQILRDNNIHTIKRLLDIAAANPGWLSENGFHLYDIADIKRFVNIVYFAQSQNKSASNADDSRDAAISDHLATLSNSVFVANQKNIDSLHFLASYMPSLEVNRCRRYCETLLDLNIDCMPRLMQILYDIGSDGERRDWLQMIGMHEYDSRELLEVMRSCGTTILHRLNMPLASNGLSCGIDATDAAPRLAVLLESDFPEIRPTKRGIYAAELCSRNILTTDRLKTVLAFENDTKAREKLLESMKFSFIDAQEIVQLVEKQMPAAVLPTSKDENYIRRSTTVHALPVAGKEFATEPPPLSRTPSSARKSLSPTTIAAAPARERTKSECDEKAALAESLQKTPTPVASPQKTQKISISKDIEQEQILEDSKPAQGSKEKPVPSPATSSGCSCS
jgi:hypothetical protein